MGHLFFDIESYVSMDNDLSGLNPYYPASKVLVISYNYYDSFYPPNIEEIEDPTCLKEWEYKDEREMLSSFYDKLKVLRVKDKYLRYYGFNITSFDLPYLFGRMRVNNITDERDIYDILFGPYAFDMYQLSTVISDDCRKHKQLWGMSQADVSRFFELQVKEGTGVQCSRHYDHEDYEKIMKYCRDEFNLEQMLDALYLHLVGDK
jgi:DNA polymerase elongation subunit (family B)